MCLTLFQAYLIQDLHLHLDRVRDDEDDGGDVNEEDEGHGRYLVGPLVVVEVHCPVPVHGNPQQAQARDVNTRTLIKYKLMAAVNKIKANCIGYCKKNHKMDAEYPPPSNWGVKALNTSLQLALCIKLQHFGPTWNSSLY